MNRPDVAYLVVASEHAGHHVRAVFENRDEAHAYARHYTTQRGHRSAVTVVEQVVWWPTGSWHRDGANGDDGRVVRLWVWASDVDDARVEHAQLRHARVSRRCVGARIDVIDDPHGLTKYRCASCQVRVL